VPKTAYNRLWVEAFAARKAGDRPRLLKALREATAGFVAITDAPGNCFTEELLDLYPDAVVLLVRRDPAKWWKSMQSLHSASTIGQNALQFLLMPIPGWRWVWPIVMSFEAW